MKIWGISSRNENCSVRLHTKKKWYICGQRRDTCTVMEHNNCTWLAIDMYIHIGIDIKLLIIWKSPSGYNESYEYFYIFNRFLLNNWFHLIKYLSIRSFFIIFLGYCTSEIIFEYYKLIPIVFPFFNWDRCLRCSLLKKK